MIAVGPPISKPMKMPMKSPANMPDISCRASILTLPISSRESKQEYSRQPPRQPPRQPRCWLFSSSGSEMLCSWFLLSRTQQNVPKNVRWYMCSGNMPLVAGLLQSEFPHATAGWLCSLRVLRGGLQWGRAAAWFNAWSCVAPGRTARAQPPGGWCLRE